MAKKQQANIPTSLRDLLKYKSMSKLLDSVRDLTYIDKGTMGFVFRAIYKDGSPCVVKYVPAPKNVQDMPVIGSDAAKFHQRSNIASRREADSMLLLSNAPFVMKLIGQPEYHQRIEGDRIQYAVLMCLPYLESSKVWWKDAISYEKKALTLGIEISRALMEFEKLRIYHRDLKPTNILRDAKGSYFLTDLSEAKEENEETTTGFHGTRSYMAPEVRRLEGASIERRQHSDHRSDIYSLGIILYQLFNNGHMPFLNTSGDMTEASTEAFSQHFPGANLDYTPRDRANALRYAGVVLPNPANADKTMQAIIAKACAFDIDDRYQSAKALHDDLAAYMSSRFGADSLPTDQDGLHPVSIGFTPSASSGTPGKFNKKIAVIAAAAAAVLAVGVLAAIALKPVPPTPAPTPTPTEIVTPTL